MQRYFCQKCRRKFQHQRRQSGLGEKLLNQYIWQRQTYSDLASKYGKSAKWIQKKLDTVGVKSVVKLNPRPLTVVADVTFFSKTNGLIVFREPNLKKNVWWKFVEYEKVDIYDCGKKHLEQNGFVIQAIVLDGKPGVRQVFGDIPAQMCHFHQKQIVKRYLTLKPKLEAGRELKLITEQLTDTDEQKFTNELNCWYEKWREFLKEKTVNPDTKRWCYKHKRLRSAYRSLTTNLPYLFTYQKYPGLFIPNTTNSLDGFFNILKSKLNVHRGLNRVRAAKVIVGLLKGRN